MSNIIINGVSVHLVARDGAIFANSREVAMVFDKAHKHVMARIESFSARGRTNFRLTSYTDNSNRQSKMYEMNRDGFMFLVMGFNGEKAENFKLDFIDAFNKMEQMIRNNTRPLTQGEQIQLIAQGYQELDDRVAMLEKTKRLESWQERALIEAKNKKVYSFNPSDAENTQKLHRAVWAHFKKHFSLPRYNELPAVKFEEGIDFINRIALIDLVG